METKSKLKSNALKQSNAISQSPRKTLTLEEKFERAKKQNEVVTKISKLIPGGKKNIYFLKTYYPDKHQIVEKARQNLINAFDKDDKVFYQALKHFETAWQEIIPLLREPHP